MKQIRPGELAAMLSGDNKPQVIDVREPWEYAICRIPDSTHLPMGEITRRHGEIDPNRPVVCVCHHGMRSLQVAVFLARQGFTDVINLSGGIDAWAREVDPACPKY